MLVGAGVADHSAGFNPRPSGMRGDALAGAPMRQFCGRFQSTPLGYEGRCNPIDSFDVDNPRFNPRPSGMRGDASTYRATCSSAAVSIHAPRV